MKQRLINYLGKVITVLIVGFTILCLGLFIKIKLNPTQIPTAFGYRAMAVLTGSMRPSIEPGDMVVVKVSDPKEIKKGDVITYKAGEGLFVTHRVVEKLSNNGHPVFKTKGDANNIEDENLVLESEVIGRLAWVLPYGGYVAKFARSKAGIFVFILLPIIILIGSEFYSILGKMKKEREKIILKEKLNEN